MLSFALERKARGAVFLFEMYIKVSVMTEQNREEFRKISADSFEARLTEEAKQNRANKRLLELVRAHFKMPTGVVRIVSGHHSPHKILEIDL